MGKLEELKEKFLIWKNKRKILDKEKTIQVHKDINGELRDYYISDPTSESKAKYLSVVKLKEDYEKQHFVYRGVVSAANNAFGILETNCPIEEIVSTLAGNLCLQEILGEEYSSKARDRYYTKINESLELPENHYTYFTKPTIALGSIAKKENGDFVISETVSIEVEEKLKKEREEANRKKALTNKEFIVMDFGDGMMQVKEDCWLSKEDKMVYCGINKEALYYRYKPDFSKKLNDGTYVYIGILQLGEGKGEKRAEDNVIELVKPYNYQHVVIWTNKLQLVEYFMNKKFDHLNFALGSLFTLQNIKQAKVGPNNQKILGGIGTNVEGLVETTFAIPENIESLVEKYLESDMNDIIDFNAYSSKSKK